MSHVGTVPTAVLAPAGVPFVWLGQHYGLISPASLVGVVFVLCIAHFIDVASGRWLAADPTNSLRLHLRVFAGIAATAAVIHSVGWGTLLIVAYLFTALKSINEHGSRVAAIVMRWIVLVVIVGQVGIMADWFPSVLNVRESNGVAVCNTLTVLAIVQLFGSSVRRAEEAEEQLEVKARHYESLVRHADDIIGVIDDDGKVLTANPAVERILGFPLENLVGRHLSEFVTSQPMAAVKAMIDGVTVAVANEDTPIVRHCTLRHSDGTNRHLVITFTTPSGDWSGKTILNIHDTTTQHELEHQLRQEATHDPLTGLLNRKAFADHVQAGYERGLSQGHGLAVLYLDLDGFKAVNDTYGHSVGDRVLLEAAQRVRSALLPTETLARLGGDEFCVLVENPSRTRPVELAERIIAAVALPIDLPCDQVQIGVSIGVAHSRDLAQDPEELLVLADHAMYEAKRRGKSGYVLADAAAHPLRHAAARSCMR